MTDAVSFVYKSFIILNIPFTTECKHIFTFFQAILEGIETDYKRVMKLVEDVKTFLKAESLKEKKTEKEKQNYELEEEDNIMEVSTNEDSYNFLSENSSMQTE